MEKSSQPVTSLETKQQVARMEHLKNQKVEKLFFFFENEIKILKKKGGMFHEIGDCSRITILYGARFESAIPLIFKKFSV